MSTVLRPDTLVASVEATAVPPAGFAVPLRRWPTFRDAFRAARRSRALRVSGQFAAVAGPVTVLDWPDHADVVVLGPALTLLVLGGWWIPLRIAFNTTLRATGPAAAAAAGTFVGFVLASALTLWLPVLKLAPLNLLETAGLVFLLTTSWEMFARARLARPQKVLVLGATGGASEFAAEAGRSADPAFDVVGVVTDSAEAVDQAPPLLGSLAELANVVEAQQPDLVVLADADPGLAIDRLLESSWREFRVVSVSHFFEHACGRVPLTHISRAWFMSILHLRQPAYSRWSKRAFDVVVATLGLVAGAPLFLAVATAVRLSGKPVLFRQVRLGERGKRFEMIKFRTMDPSGEADGQARWAAEHDRRVTSVGRFLRHSRLDELPQLWNVLRGEMSIVGPRPERPEFLQALEEIVPFWSRRLLVKPGVTGWAQIRSGYAADFDSTTEKLSYDLWYLRHRTLLLDLVICVKTLGTVFSGAGAR
jgi:exopolysaccharide biosynthesis polyprenyl glycosylphosphotransferase